MNIRFHTTKNLVFRGGYEDIVYLRKEDVVNYIREIAGTEETDVRTRLIEAANNIDSVGKQVTTAK